MARPIYGKVTSRRRVCRDRVRGGLVYVDGSARVPVPSKPFRGASCLRGNTAIRCLLLLSEEKRELEGWRREMEGEGGGLDGFSMRLHSNMVVYNHACSTRAPVSWG